MSRKLDLDYEEVLNIYNQLNSYRKTAKHFNTSHTTIINLLNNHIKDNEKFNLNSIQRRLKTESIENVSNDLGMSVTALEKFIQILTLNQKLARIEQKYRDLSNVKGKHFREYARVDNTLEELSKSIQKYIKEDRFNYQIKNNKDTNIIQINKNIGVIHLSDLHLNEQVDIDSNQFNWDIASKRLKKFIDQSLHIFSFNKVREVLIVGTGDFLNSDRRLDELMTNSDNRAQSSVLAYKLIRSVILQVAEKYKVTYTFVCGNESRIDQDIHNSKILVSNNFDYMIGMHLYTFFEDSDRVKIILPNNPEEQIVKIFNEYILLIHGHKGIGDNIENSLSKIISKYSRTKGINISYALYGHIHSCLISDNFSRSGSLVGDNEYSFNKLQLSGKASQNCYVFEPDGSKNCYRIDLQNIDNVNGYPFNKDLESYNTKSKSKTFDETVIVKVVI